MALKASVIFDIQGNALSQLRRLQGETDRLARGQVGALRKLGQAADTALGKIDRLGNRYTALLTGAAGLGAVKTVVALDARFTRLGTTANISADKVADLKREIFEVARAPDIRVDPGEIIAATEKIVEKVGDLGLARDNLRNIGLAIQATGAGGANVGALIGDAFEKFGLKGAEEMLSALAVLNQQGKLGAFTLQNLATQGERVTAAYAVTNRVGPQAVREMGAVLQMVRKGTGSAEEAATAFEAMLRTFSDSEKIKLLKQHGISITDPQDPKRMKSAVDLMKELIVKTGGRMELLSQIFDDRALRAFSAAVIEFQQTGGFASFDTFLNASADTGTVLQDSARNAGTAAAAWQNLKTALVGSADRNLAEPIKFVSDAINSLDPDQIDRITQALVGLGAAVGLGVIGAKGFRFGKGVFNFFRGRRGGAAAGAGALGGLSQLSGAIPVFVVNMPGAGFGLGPGAAPGGSAGAGAAGKGVAKSAGRVAGALGKVKGAAGGVLRRVPGLGWVIAGVDAGSILLDEDTTAGEKAVGLAGVGGGLAGSAAGAGLGALGGAAVGSVVPLLGTAVGAAVGGVAGGALGFFLGEEAVTRLATEIREAIIGEKAQGEVTVKFENAPPGTRVMAGRAGSFNLQTEMRSGPLVATP